VATAGRDEQLLATSGFIICAASMPIQLSQQRAIILRVIVLDWANFVPEIKPSGDGCANGNADQRNQR
jgi:hypothetical protein